MSNKNKNDGLKVERVYTSDALKDLVRENAELKAFVNAPFTKGSKTTRGDYIKTVWDLSKYLDKAKELSKRFLEFANYDIDYDPEHPQEYTDLWNELCEQTKQFLSEVEK